ncbi:hypothetical protein [Catellatospora chokoriensis]|uniref:Uncharacterized protein n=1 Tax=Catellatospora chokoriensis TaxID=310353 RepID=A0A8J3KEU1_9ACTN|nr:hypothetical protein [Catellatospora chokoriensis]GIF94594.1 hypothetical protein Cch02nite_80380 [Catellatospora chokoriensis]
MRIEKQTYLNAKSVGSGRTISGLELVRCAFTGSNLSQFDDPELGLVVQEVTATRCVAARSFLSGVRIEDVVVDGLTTTSGLRLFGCGLRHVRLRGRVGTWFVLAPNPTLPGDVRIAFTTALVKYYRGVDWALDITEAEFDSANLSFVPGDLVRRDPETQFLLRRSSFADVDPSTLPSFASIAVRRFEETPLDSIVAVAARRSKRFTESLAHLQELRDRGLAE